MIKVSQFIQEYKEGKVPAATMVKMAAFKAELEKTAVGQNFLSGVGNIMKQHAPSVVAGAATMGLGALVYEAIRGAEKVYQNFKLDSMKEPKFDEMAKLHPELVADKDIKKRAMLYYDSLWNYAPTIAQDPLAAGAYIKRALEMHNVAQGPLPELIQYYSGIQKDVNQAKDFASSDYATPIGAMVMPLRPMMGGVYGKMPAPVNKTFKRVVNQNTVVRGGNKPTSAGRTL